MKTIEEKARAYDEALERAKNEYQTHKSFNGFREMLVRIFPELREEEYNEKISAMLIRHIMQERGSLSNDEAAEVIAWLEKQGKKQPFDYENVNIQPKDFATKVEPKFKVGDWVVHDMSDGRKAIGQIVNITNKSYVLDGEGFNTFYFNDLENDYHLWTIQDAKDGDVLAYETDKEDLWIMIYWSLYEPYEGHVHYHALLANDNFSDKGTCCICINDLKPATKEQRDTLMKAMADAGWEFDFEKKELKKIEEEVNGEDYGIDGLWHAQRILEETLGGVEGYQTDDGILEHKAAITAVKKLYEQKPAEWSEEDEKILRIIDGALFRASSALGTVRCSYDDARDWLESIKQRYIWKPSDEQITWLYRAADDASKDSRMKQILNELLSDLKKLKGE